MSTDHVRVHVAELAPTQPTIGGFEAQLKAQRFDLMHARDTEGYLEDKEDKGKPVQVVRGPGAYFLVDGHHTMSGIARAGRLREVRVVLVDDLSDEGDPGAFWDAMTDRGHAMLLRQGQPCEHTAIPRRLEDLEDDPFRTVAWLVRKMDAFEDLKEPYQEFGVADFLREHMRFSPGEPPEYERAALHAFDLLRSTIAREAHGRGELPGFIDEPAPDDLIEAYYEVLAKARAPRIYRG